MPHISPIQWLTILLLLWIILISINIFFYRFKQLTYNSQIYWTNTIKWKWYQDKNKL